MDAEAQAQATPMGAGAGAEAAPEQTANGEPGRRRGGIRGLVGGSSRGGRQGVRQRLNELFAEPSPQGRQEPERQAAEELRQAMSPALDRLVQAVPGASSPDEAMSTLQRRLQDLGIDSVPEEPPPPLTPPPSRVEAVVHYQVRHHLARPKNRYRPTQHERNWRGWVRDPDVRRKRGNGNGND